MGAGNSVWLADLFLNCACLLPVLLQSEPPVCVVPILFYDKRDCWEGGQGRRLGWGGGGCYIFIYLFPALPLCVPFLFSDSFSSYYCGCFRWKIFDASEREREGVGVGPGVVVAGRGSE